MKNAVFGLAFLLVGLLAHAVALAGVAEIRAAAPAQPQHRATAQLLKDLLNEGQVMNVADTHSMEPTFNNEDLLVVERVELSTLKVGDIVVFERRAHYQRGKFLEGGPVCHRIVEIDSGEIITQGDNNNAVDTDKTYARNLRGRVAYIVNGQSGRLRDMRVSREGEELTDLQAINREMKLANQSAQAAAATP